MTRRSTAGTVPRISRRSAEGSVSERTPHRPTHAAVLVLAGALVFANGLAGPFIIDDATAIESNRSIRQLLPLSGPLTPPRETPVAGRPLINLSLALNYAVSGFDTRAYRVTNLAIHLLCALVLFGVVRRTLDFEATIEPLRVRSRDVAFVCALIWMLHPLQTEVVDYVTQRTTSLMGLMYLLTLYSSVRALGRGSGRWECAAVLACAAGMACKESMATAPILVALYDRIFVCSTWREAARRRRRLYRGLAATWLVLAGLMAGVPRTTVGFATGVDAWTYLLNQAPIIVDYLRLTFLPFGLVVDYGVPQSLALHDVFGSVLLVAALGGTTLAALARWPRVGFLGVWFFITLAPTSSFVPIATEVGAERRMYLPLAAIVVLLVSGVFLAATARRVSKSVALAGCAGVCVMLAAGTMLRNREYRSRLSLAEVTVERRPHGRAFLRLGTILLESGRRTEALDYFRRAKRADAVGARFVLGTEHLVDGNLESGILELTEFVRRHPTNVNVVPARAMLGRAYLAQGRVADAVAALTEILRQVPTHHDAHYLLGDALFDAGRVDDALPHLQFVASRRPGDVVALGKFGTALAASGRNDEAVAVLAKAVAADPDHAHARRMLGRALAGQGRFEDAIVQLERSVALAPDDPAAQRDLAAARVTVLAVHARRPIASEQR